MSQVIAAFALAILACVRAGAGETAPEGLPAVTVDLNELPAVAPVPKADSPRAGNDPEAVPPRATIEDDVPAPRVGTDAPPVKTNPIPAISTGDPEFRRPQVFDPNEAQPGKIEVPVAARAPVEHRPRLGDPELRARFGNDELVGEAIKSGEISVLEAVQLRRALAEDHPRFPAGEGLDSNAAPQLSRPDVPADSSSSVGEDARIAEIAALARGQSGGATEEKPKPFDQLIEESRKNEKRLRELAGLANPNANAGSSNEDKVDRNEQAARLLEALAGGYELARLSGQISDAVAKNLLPARVRIVDGTGSAVEAPLNDGFYARGIFDVGVLPGPVKIEVHRGRFFSSSNTSTHATRAPMPTIGAVLGQPGHLNFAKQGWYLADLDIGLRTEPGERAVWRGPAPLLEDLELAAEAEGVHAIGVQLPRNDPAEAQRILDRAGAANSAKRGVLVLPVFPGPRHVFQGVVSGLGVSRVDNLPWEISEPTQPLHDAFEDIHAHGGLAILKNFNGLSQVDIKSDLLPLVPALRATNYFHTRDTRAKLYAAASLPFETVAGPAYDALAFDGTTEVEKLWFGLLNQGYEVPIVGAGGGSLEGGRRPYGQTLVQCGANLTRQTLFDAIRRGKTVVSFGPVVFARIADRDRGPGDWLAAEGRPLRLQIQAYSSMLPGMQLDRVEIIRNGKVLHTQLATEGESAINNLQWPFTESSNAWYVLRVTERRNKADGSSRGGTAWSSPIYFRSAAHAAPQRAQARVAGTLRSGTTPVKGSVTIVAPGEAERQIETDANGRYSILVPVRAALVFAAPGCEPVAKRVFEHPDVQSKFGELQAEREGTILDQLSRPALYSSWRLQLSELEWDISLIRRK